MTVDQDNLKTVLNKYFCLTVVVQPQLLVTHSMALSKLNY